MDRRQDRGGRRDGRAAEARAHTEEMARRFAAEIDRAAAAVRRIDGMPKASAAAPVEPVSQPALTAPEPAPQPDGTVAGASAAEPETAEVPAAASETVEASDSAAPADEPASSPAAAPLPAVTVTDEDAVGAIIARGRGRAAYCDLAVLDFASFTRAGGGYDRGAWAQEQALCADSYLYNVLERQADWYAENRRRNINCELYRDRALAVPAVRFARGKLHAYADVIVAAAPNARRAREEYGLSDGQLERAMRGRIRFALAVAAELGRDRVVLGAFGCGAFGWDPSQVARLFREELARDAHGIREAVFAVPRVRYNENHERFAHELARFPEPPAAPFGVKEPEPVPVPDEDDEDEDDWRKYL